MSLLYLKLNNEISSDIQFSRVVKPISLMIFFLFTIAVNFLSRTAFRRSFACDVGVLLRLAATLLGNVDYGQQELTMRQWKSRKSDITP